MKTKFLPGVSYPPLLYDWIRAPSGYGYLIAADFPCSAISSSQKFSQRLACLADWVCIWLVVEPTPLNNTSEIGNLPQNRGEHKQMKPPPSIP